MAKSELYDLLAVNAELVNRRVVSACDVKRLFPPF